MIEKPKISPVISRTSLDISSAGSLCVAHVGTSWWSVPIASEVEITMRFEKTLFFDS